MVFLNWKELPWFWQGFDSFPFAAAHGAAGAGRCSPSSSAGSPSARGSPASISRSSRRRMTFALMLAFFRNDMGFGGNNGLTDFKDILGFPTAGRRRPASRCSCSRPSRSRGGYLLCRWIVTSQARQGARRRSATRRAARASSATGSSTTSSSVFTLSAMLAGVAGALYVPQVGIINPSEFAPANSIEVVIWVAVGGRGTLVGRDPRRGAGQCAARPGSPARCRNSGSSRSAACSSSSRCSCRSGILGAARRTSWDGAAQTLAIAGAAPKPSRRRRSRAMSAPVDARHLLYLDNVTRLLRRLSALNALSLAIDHGEMRAIIGPNGAGKTTMMDVITGKTRPNEGTALFDGSHDLTALDEADDRRARHRPQVPEADRVRDAHGRRQPPAGAQGDRSSSSRPCSRGATAQERERIDAVLERVRLDGSAHRQAGELSHGQKQWLEIGMLLAQEPKLLLVDEPAAGMTDQETARYRRSAARHRQDAGRGRRGARHGVRARSRREGHGACTRAPCWPKDRSTR